MSILFKKVDYTLGKLMQVAWRPMIAQVIKQGYQKLVEERP